MAVETLEVDKPEDAEHKDAQESDVEADAIDEKEHAGGVDTPGTRRSS